MLYPRARANNKLHHTTIDQTNGIKEASGVERLNFPIGNQRPERPQSSHVRGISEVLIITIDSKIVQQQLVARA